MDVVRFAEAPFYTAPDHDDDVARRLQGGEASMADFATVGHSTFSDGAVVPMEAGPIGKIYVVTEGAITIEQVMAFATSCPRATASSSPPTKRAPF